MTGKRQDGEGPGRPRGAEARRARLAAELRANLLKRKAQAKARVKDTVPKDRNEGRQS